MLFSPAAFIQTTNRHVPFMACCTHAPPRRACTPCNACQRPGGLHFKSASLSALCYTDPQIPSCLLAGDQCTSCFSACCLQAAVLPQQQAGVMCQQGIHGPLMLQVINAYTQVEVKRYAWHLRSLLYACMQRPHATSDDSSGLIECHFNACMKVEVKRDPNLHGQPAGVVQYNPFGDLRTIKPEEPRIFNDSNGSLIAVGYEARAAGVKRCVPVLFSTLHHHTTRAISG